MLYICMSAAGSVPVLICLILWGLQKEAYDYRLGRSLLLISMFFYLVPFQMVKYILPEWTVSILKLPMDIHVQQNFYKVVEIKNVLSPEEALWIPRWLSMISAVWLCCVVLCAVYQIVKYRIDIRRLLAQSQKAFTEVNGETVEVLVNKNIRTPYTVGFIKRLIIVPEESLGNPCFAMCYRHEEQHRRNFDSLMKLVCVLIICIHWFNPVAILLLWLYSMTAEYICDAAAAEGCTDEEKKNYARLLAGLSSMKKPLSVVWRNNLSGSEKLIRRRITYMMKRKALMKKWMAVAVAVITVLASASTILAYEPFVSVKDGTIEEVSFGMSGAFFDDNQTGTGDCDFSVSDTVFVYEDSTQEPIADTETSSYALCNHKMTSGYYHVHAPKSSGGCSVTVYNAQKCTKCGYLELGSIYATYTYTVCPHK